MADQMDALFDRAQGGLARIEERSADDGQLKQTIRELEELLEVIDEAEDLLDEVDLTELPDAIDPEKLLAAIDAGELPDAIRDHELGDAIDVKALMKAVEFRELWEAVDITDFVREERELEHAVDDMAQDDDDVAKGDETDTDGTGGDEDELIGELESLLDDDEAEQKEDDGLVSRGIESLVGSNDDEDDEAEDKSFLEEGADAVSDAGNAVDDAVDDFGDGGGLGGGDGGGLADVPSEAYQTLIQQKAMDAIDEFRDGVLEARKKLKSLYEENREKTKQSQEERQPSSRNPTAYSTILTDRPDIGSATRHSTVPERVTYSTAPPTTRIYGSRFEKESED